MCCLFGLVDYGHSFSACQKTRILAVLSRECEARGTDATGIAYCTNNRLRVYKRPWPAEKMRFHLSQDAYAIMGHTRMTTQGSEKHNYNNHPFTGRCGNVWFALAHNGVLYNDKRLRAGHGLPETNIETDSYIAVQLLEEERALSFDSLKTMAEAVEGSFSFTVLTERSELYFIKGSNPLMLYQFPKQGFYLYASTEEILNRALNRLHINRWKHQKIKLSSGDLLKIDSDGRQTRGTFTFRSTLSAYRPYWSWFDCMEPMSSIPDDRMEYLEELCTMAPAFGFSPGDVTRLLERGCTAEEIEEAFYDGEL